MDFRKEKFNLLDEQHRLRGIASTTDVPGGAPAEGNKPIIEGSLSIIKKKNILIMRESFFVGRIQT